MFPGSGCLEGWGPGITESPSLPRTSEGRDKVAAFCYPEKTGSPTGPMW